jgi:hypothetical protein
MTPDAMMDAIKGNSGDGLGLYEYEWGTDLYASDVFESVLYFNGGVDTAKEYLNIPDNYLDKCTILRHDLTERELEDFTQEQLRTVQDEIDMIDDYIDSIRG